MLEGEGDFRFGVLGPIVMVFGQGLEEGGKAFAGMVEVGDGLDEPIAGEVHQVKLELAEGASGLEGLLRRLHRFEGLRPFHEHKGAPVFARRHSDNGSCPSRVGMTIRRAAGDVLGGLRFELVADMRGDPHEVFHQLRRVLEDMLVDLLVNVADARAALVVGCRIGLVDVADLERLGVEDLTVNLKLLRDVLKFFFRVGHNSNVG